ncbi:hypothetical protein [Mesotoga sp. UBA5847]|uniref:hypothetical protein n=1 Tax=Mesotoga sp. UBA5847 TaxID=1946859 RepID=UPI0025E86D0B|nr:hypothetical protein [Mesotoga sp. UBA5847]
MKKTLALLIIAALCVAALANGLLVITLKDGSIYEFYLDEIESIIYTAETEEPLKSAYMSLYKDVFAPGEEITLYFYGTEGLETYAWIGIVPSDIPHGSESENDLHDIQYAYVGGMTDGLIVFTAPWDAGFYDFRLNDSDSGGVEIDFLTFEVRE